MKPKSFNVFPAIALLTLITLACSSLSSLPSNSSNGGGETNGGSSGNTGSTSSGANSTSSPSSNVLFQDDFSDSNSGWGIGSDANKVVQYVNNALEFQVIKANDFVYSTPNDTAYQDVHIEVTVNAKKSNTDTSFGILCDQQVTGEAFYYFAVSPNGQYAIARAAVAKDDVFLTHNNQWGESKLIPVNAPSYTLGADCANGSLTLYVNGKKVDSVTDSAYTKGTVGVFAWSDEKTSSVDDTFDDFVVTSSQ